MKWYEAGRMYIDEINSSFDLSTDYGRTTLGQYAAAIAKEYAREEGLRWPLGGFKPGTNKYVFFCDHPNGVEV